MKVTLRENTAVDKNEVPYIADIEVFTLTVDANSVFEVPVHINNSTDKTTYNVEICGFRAETDKIEEIAYITEDLFASLVNRARLPSYVFIARGAGGVYPVYTVDHEVLATTPGGPLFQHIELAKVREYLSDYLHDIGILGEKGSSDKLHVRGIDLKTLGLRRPVFYLKKRVEGENDFWAPVFKTADGKRIYTYAANNRREVPISGGQEVIFLRELVAQALLTDNRLTNIHDLRPDRLFPNYWERLKATLTPEGHIKANDIEMPIYSNNFVYIAVETRPDENRFSLFVGKDVENVRRRAEEDLTRRGVTAVTPE